MKHLLSLLIISMITGCSTLNFWSSEEEDLEEPRPLQRIENLFKLDRIWSRGFNSDNSLGNYRIAFDGDEIIITNENGDIFNINKFNGKVNNKYEFEVDVSVSVAFGFNKIVLADKDGMIYCLSAANKDLIWSLDSGAEVLSIPAIDAKAVVVHTSAGQLLAIDTNSGSLNWSYRSQLPNLTIRGNSTPLIANDQVFATFDNGRLGSFDIATGFSLFDGPISYKEGSSELENLIDADSTPVIEGPLVFATNYQGSLTGFSIQEGRPVLSIKSSSFHPPVIMSRNVVVIQDSGEISSFSNQTLTLDWENTDYLRRKPSNAVDYQGNIIFGDVEGFVHVIDGSNGNTIGRMKISSNPIKNLVKRGNEIYILDSELKLFVINRDA